MTENDDIRSRPAARPIPPKTSEETDAKDSANRDPGGLGNLKDPLATSPDVAEKQPRKIGCAGWTAIIGALVIGLILLAPVLSSWEQQAEDRRAEAEATLERERTDAFIDAAMAQCANELSQWQGGTPSDYVYSTRSASAGVVTLKGAKSANWACQFAYTSFDDRNLELIQATWDSPSGEVTEVLRPGASGVPTQQTIRISEQCAAAFQAAAAVPLSRDNNEEVYATASACQTVEEWWLAVKKYPNAFGATMYPDEDLWIYLVTACGGAEGSPVCRDAEAKGIF